MLDAQATQAPPPPPPPGTPALLAQQGPLGGVATTATPAPAGPLRPLTEAEREAIRDARRELSNQLTSAADRRENLVEELKDMPGPAQAGVLARIELLDQRIIQLEADIAQTGRQLTSGTTAPLPEIRYIYGLPENVFTPVAILSTLFIFTPLALAFARLLWKRGTRIATQPTPEQQQHNERVDRIEQAVEAIAIEVERVGEAQRYQGRMLTENNLMPALPSAHQPAEPIRLPDAVSVPSRPSET